VINGEILGAVLCAGGVGWMAAFLVWLILARPIGEGRRIDNSRPSILDGPDDRLLREDLYPAAGDGPYFVAIDGWLWEMPPIDNVAPGTNPRGARRVRCRACREEGSALGEGFLDGYATCSHTEAGAE